MDAIRKIEELTALAERLKLEAQIHAGEARSANATIAEIYQLCTGSTGEPGNWHGAEPVRQALASKEAELLRLRGAIQKAISRKRHRGTLFLDIEELIELENALTQPPKEPT